LRPALAGCEKMVLLKALAKLRIVWLKPFLCLPPLDLQLKLEAIQKELCVSATLRAFSLIKKNLANLA